jgi:hypothetical protein
MLKNDYKMVSNSKYKLPRVFFNTTDGKLWIDKLEEYKYKEREYNIN